MKRVCNWVLVAMIFAALTAAAGQDSTSAVNNVSATAPSGQSHFTNAPTFSERYPRYRLHASDTFDLVFEYTPEFNQTATIQPDGYVTLRSVGDVYLNGLTVDQATAKVTEAYGKVLSRPVVSLLLKDFEKPYFIADGMVNRPGKYELRGDTTATQAIAMAGGLNPLWAKHSQVVLFRRVDDNWVETKVLNVKSMQKNRDLSEDVHLRPGDMLFVPKNQLSKIQQWIPVYSVDMLGAQTKAF
ncbi:MAG TPA: polysaccharide biosynthesis/export family protein [Terriglobales bacterium]|jgi:polysaccharide export outer membrane protein|nr:polysaccharide biosynthesis/export family protein [Terriglobales bacterium]